MSADSKSSDSTNSAVPIPIPVSSSPSSSPIDASDVLVQYIVMRSDLIKSLKWNTGSLISNGAHASIAVIMENFNEIDVQNYINPNSIIQMHKVVLSVINESELNSTSELLNMNNIKHKIWIEQPENIPSCLAIRPYKRSIIQPLLKHLKLFR